MNSCPNSRLACLHTSNEEIDRAFRVAVGDLASNIVSHRSGLLGRARPVVMAGLDYSRPWTRDAAINT